MQFMRLPQILERIPVSKGTRLEANGGIERKHRAIVGSSPSSFPSGTSIGHYHGGDG